MKHTLLLILLLLPALSQAQTVSFTVSMDTVCQDSCITLINTSRGTIDSIKWVTSMDTVTNPHSDTTTLCFLSAGVVTVKLYVYDSGRVDSTTQVVSIKPMPHPTLYGRFAVPDVYLSYQWYSQEWNISDIVLGATSHTYEAGMGAWYVVVDSGGCLGRSDTGFVWEGVYAINSPSNQIRIFPSPASSLLIISSKERMTDVAITNLLGQIVYTYHCNDLQVTIDIADLPKGMYLLKINGSEVRKFVKE